MLPRPAALFVPVLLLSMAAAPAPAPAPAAEAALEVGPVKATGHLERQHKGWEKRSVDVKVNWLEVKKAATPALAKAVNRWLLSQMQGGIAEGHAKVLAKSQQAAADAYVAHCLAAWRADEADCFEDNSSLKYQFSAEARVVSDDGQWVTLSVQTYEYTGGAHGSPGFTLASFNAKSGEAFDLQAALGEEGEKRFRQWLTPRVKHAYAAQMAANYGYTGKKAEESTAKEEAEFKFFDGAVDKEGGVALPAHAGLVKDGLLLQYNPYEVAAYCYGAPSLVIPWRDLKAFAQAAGPLDR